MSAKVFPVLSFDNDDEVSRRQNYLRKVRSEYTTSTRVHRFHDRGIERREKKTQDNRINDLENTGGKKTRKQHNKSKFMSRIQAIEKKRYRRVAACNEWEYVCNGAS
jgi:hypothetical protein